MGPASFNNATSKRTVREQLFRCGVRLAAVLEDIYHPMP